MRGLRLGIAVSLGLATSAGAAAEAPVLVCGAVSLSAPLREIADRTSTPQAPVALHLAGSTALRRQIESGAPCDVFVAAGTDDAAALRAQGHLDTLAVFAGNSLVVVTRRGTTSRLQLPDLCLPELQRIAVGDPVTAPLGVYTLQALAAAGLLPALGPKLVPGADALHVVAAVASGNTDAGIAYATDARRDSRVQVASTIPDSLHAPIVYTIAPLKRAADRAAAARFVAFACGPEGAAVLQRHGFTAAPAAPAAAAAPPGGSRAAASTLAPTRWLAPVLLSARVALLATLCAATVGLALATFLAQTRSRRAREVTAAVIDLPLVLPPTVVGLVLLELLGPQRPLGALLQRAGLQPAFTWGAAVVAAAVMALPLMVRPARSALEAVPQRYVQAARCLGAGPWRAFWRVQLPLARRGVAAGVLLAFFRALGEFGATLIVAGNIPGRTQTLPLAIYSAVFTGRTGDALVCVLGVSLFGFAGALAAQRLVGAKSP